MWTAPHRQLRRYFAMLGAVVGAYVCYTLLVVPWIEGPPRAPTVARSPEKFDLFRYKADLVAWLPEDAWERGPCKQISTRTGHLFFREYQSYEDGRVEVRPLTIILQQSNPGAQNPPLIVQAPEGATLQLDQPLSLGGDSIQLISGSLAGPVTIRRSATPDGPGELFLQTSLVQLNKERIQTLQQVDFRFGPHYGKGRNLVIDFDADPLQAQQPTIRGIRGVRHMELRHIDQLHVQPPQDQTAPQANAEVAAASSTSRSGALYPNGFDVVCGGPFEFNLESNTASLLGGVRMTSVDSANDYLVADHIAFELGASPPSDGSNRSPGQATAGGPWSLRRIAAHGQPAVLHLETQSLDVRGDELAYRLLERTIELKGRKPVELRQAGFELFAPAALYQLTSDGSLGVARIVGPGLARRPATETQPALAISWSTLLAVEDDADQKRITLDGAATVEIGPASKLSADRIQFWLWQLPNSSPAEPNQTAVAAEGSAGGHRPKWTWHPDRMVAAGNANIVSEQVVAQVRQLTAQWPAPTNSTSAQVDSTSAYVQLMQRPNPSSPARAQLNQQDQPSGVAAQPRLPLSVRADTATVQMLAGEGFREIVFEERVHIEQPTAQGPSNFELDGSRLEIAPQEAQRFRMTLRGTAQAPCQAKASQMLLSGSNVQLDQTANRLWIEGFGRMVAQQQTAPQQLAQPENTQAALAPPTTEPTQTTIDVSWDGGLVFDGRQVYLETGVRAKCDQVGQADASHLEAHCAAINITLSEAVDLSGSSAESPTSQPELELLTLIGNIAPQDRVFAAPAAETRRETVLLSRQSFLPNRETATVQTLEVPWGQWNAASGQLNMNGPGLVQLWQRATPLTAAGRATEIIPESPPLTNTSIRFEQSLTGNLQRSELVFAGKVRTIHGNVRDWNQALDPDQKTMGPDEFLLRSGQLQITQWRRSSAAEAHVEIIALGQAQLQGETFDAFAERIGYDQSQEKVLLEGDPRNGAKLTYQTAPDGPRNPLVASKIMFNLRDNTTQVEGFKHGVLTTGSILPQRNQGESIR